MTEQEQIRITQDEHTVTRFVRRSDGEWREAPTTSAEWRCNDADASKEDGGVRERDRVPKFYGVGLVNLPNGELFEIQTQDWRFGDDGPTTFSQPIHGQSWGEDGRTVRVIYRFPDGGAPIGHDKLVPILDVLAANGHLPIELGALRKRLQNAARR